MLTVQHLHLVDTANNQHLFPHQRPEVMLTVQLLFLLQVPTVSAKRQRLVASFWMNSVEVKTTKKNLQLLAATAS